MSKKGLVLFSFTDKYGGKITIDVDEIVEMRTQVDDDAFLQVYLECHLKSGRICWLYNEVIFKKDIPKKYEVNEDMCEEELKIIGEKNQLYINQYIDKKKKEFIKKANYIQDKISAAKIGKNFVDNNFENDYNATFYNYGNNNKKEAILNIVYQENSGLLSSDEVLQKEDDPLYKFRTENEYTFYKFSELNDMDS